MGNVLSRTYDDEFERASVTFDWAEVREAFTWEKNKAEVEVDQSDSAMADAALACLGCRDNHAAVFLPPAVERTPKCDPDCKWCKQSS